MIHSGMDDRTKRAGDVAFSTLQGTCIALAYRDNIVIMLSVFYAPRLLSNVGHTSQCSDLSDFTTR